MSNRNRKPIKNSLVDVALLTAGYVDIPVFQDCVSAIKREMGTVDSSFYVFRSGNVPETRQAYDEILATIPSAHIKHSSEKLGFPAGANRVIRAGTSPLVLFISDDIILHEGTLLKLVRTMDNPQIALCGLKLIFPPDSTDPTRPAGRVQHIGHAIDIRGEITHPLIGWKPDNPKCCVTREVQSVTGAVFMVRRNLFIRAGGFFEGYGKGFFEDVDLNLTLRTIPYKEIWEGENKTVLNYKIWINAEATAYHHTSATWLKKKEQLPMQENKMILFQRRGNLMMNDNWSFW